MLIKYERAEDAFLAVAWAIVVADRVGSALERNFMHADVKSIALFNVYTEEEYSNMVGAMYMKANQTFLDESGVLIDERVLEMIAAVNDCLNSEDCLEVYRMAVGIACVDELCKEEIELLALLQSGLNIGETDAIEVHKEFKYML
ncbi:hypothetical protein E3V33_00310 [Candidatus Marinimicrobia bacterium MT.SAG.4]|nr:hypothetical protein E3V33_00310 [Candidatus Marinimicrobia bacterium MT.SAG.4]